MQEENSTKKQRDTTFDLMKGVAILCVIAAHCIDSLKHTIYSFHMPLFFIIAGIFFTRREPLSSMKRDFQRLILPFLAGMGVIFIWDLIVAFTHADVSIGSSFTKCFWALVFPAKMHSKDSIIWGEIVALTTAMWFFVALFWCKTIYNLMARHLKPIPIIALCVFLSITAIYVSNNIIDLPFALAQAFGALIFFALGVLLKEKKEQYSHIILPILIILMIAWLIFVFTEDYVNIGMFSNYYKSYFHDVATAVGGTFAIWLLCKYVLIRIPHLNRFLAFCGMNSLLILCVHAIDMRTGISYIMHLRGTGSIWMLSSIVFCIFACIVLNRFTWTKQIFGITKWSEVKLNDGQSREMYAAGRSSQ